MFEEQILKIRVGTRREKIDAPPRTKLPHALKKILHHLLIRLESEPAKGHFLHPTRLRIHQAQISIRRRIQLFRRQNLHKIDVESTADQGGESRFVAGRIQKIAENNRNARLARFHGTTPQRGVEIRAATSGKRRDVLKELKRAFPATHGTERSARGRFGPGYWRLRNNAVCR